MPHLDKLPTWFVKGDKRLAAYYTIQAREFAAAGYVEEGKKAAPAPQPKPQPEIVNEVGAEPYDSTESLTEPMANEDDLDSMTKAELLDWALEHGEDLPNNDLKAEILVKCKEIQSAL